MQICVANQNKINSYPLQLFVRYLLEAESDKVAKEIEKYLRWKKIPYQKKIYSKPKIIKFKLGFLKSITVTSFKNFTYVKIPSAEFSDVIAEFKAKKVVGKLLDEAGVEVELSIVEAQADAAKKTLILILALTGFATPAMILKHLPPYSLLLLGFSLLPVKTEVEEMEVQAFPILYPYYLIKKSKLEKMKENFS